MDSYPVSKAEVINGLKEIISEVESGRYSVVFLQQSVALGVRNISQTVQESFQTGKQITVTLTREREENAS